MKTLLTAGAASACLVLLSTAAFAEETSLFEGWNKNIEAGATYSSGNTEEETTNVAIKLNKEGSVQQWGHTIKLAAKSSKDDGVRNEEEYRAATQSRFNTTEDDYKFIELEYIKDRFSGYDYRMSENIGQGKKFYDTENFKLAGEASLGLRQTEDTNGSKDNSMLVKFAAKANWQINEHVALSEELSVAIADTTITLSETAIKNALSDNLYFKMGLTIEHNSDVPAGTDNTDTTTSINLGYSF